MPGKTEIKLRALEPEDIDILYTWENDPEGWELSNTHLPYSKAFLKEYIKNAREDIFTAGQIRLVICTPDNTPAGFLDIFEFDSFHRRAGLGILIRKENRRQGFARAALSEALKYGFQHLGLKQFFCNILEENTASIRLFTELGFQKTGIKKSWINTGIQYKDEGFYQLIREDFLPGDD